MPQPLNVVPKLVALLYDGTNSAQILEVSTAARDEEVMSEADGVLVVSPGPPPHGTVTIATGQYLIFEALAGELRPSRAVDNLDDFTVLD